MYNMCLVRHGIPLVSKQLLNCAILRLSLFLNFLTNENIRFIVYFVVFADSAF